MAKTEEEQRNELAAQQAKYQQIITGGTGHTLQQAGLGDLEGENQALLGKAVLASQQGSTFESSVRALAEATDLPKTLIRDTVNSVAAATTGLSGISSGRDPQASENAGHHKGSDAPHRTK